MARLFFRGLISATSKKEAEAMLETLTKKKLVSGGLITSGESLYWWKGTRVRKVYWNLSVFAVSKNRRNIIKIVREIQRDETPIIAFFRIASGNPDFLAWIADNSS